MPGTSAAVTASGVVSTTPAFDSCPQAAKTVHNTENNNTKINTDRPANFHFAPREDNHSPEWSGRDDKAVTFCLSFIVSSLQQASSRIWSFHSRAPISATIAHRSG